MVFLLFLFNSLSFFLLNGTRAKFRTFNATTVAELIDNVKGMHRETCAPLQCDARLYAVARACAYAYGLARDAALSMRDARGVIKARFTYAVLRNAHVPYARKTNLVPIPFPLAIALVMTDEPRGFATVRGLE